MTNRRAPTALVVALALAAVTAACKEDKGTDHAGHAPPAASSVKIATGGTVVQNEMRLLQEAMRNAVTAIAMNTLETIPESLHTVHHARELTDKAIESGTYKLPKNADKVAAFKTLDEAFHGELEKLLLAAQSKSSPATATQLGVVLSKCNECHTQYRGY